jgi:FkbM family methyltransferase
MPTELVWSNPNKPETKTVALKETPQAPRDQRGGTPVIKWGDYYIAITHEVWLWWNYLKQKDSIYRHRLIVWDKDFNFLGLSKDNLSFLDVPIEFCIGAAVYENDLLLGFGVQDNCAFVLRTPKEVVDELVAEAISAYTPDYQVDENTYEVPGYAKFKVYKNDLISDSIKRGELWEPYLHLVFNKYVTKDSVVIEGGCHIGTHTLKLSQLAKKVYAFEPLRTSWSLLKDNLTLNGVNNVVVNNLGLSNEKGTTTFAYVNKDNIGGAVLSQEGKNVYLTSIDSMDLEQLDFIKLDVEGYEKKVIEGGLETIKKFKPVITLECWDNYPNATLEHAIDEFQFLLDLGYRIEQIEHHDFLFIPDWHK